MVHVAVAAVITSHSELSLSLCCKLSKSDSLYNTKEVTEVENFLHILFVTISSLWDFRRKQGLDI